MTTINDLSNEMLIEIFSYLHVQERQRLVTVCRQWQSVIESMWLTIDKLIIKIGAKSSSYGEWEGSKWANILVKRIYDAVRVLNRLNGTLTKLDLEYDGCSIGRPMQVESAMFEICAKIRLNEQLNSVRIGSTQRNIELQIPFLEFLPKANLQHLSLRMKQNEDVEEFVDDYKTLMKATNLKYLHLETYRPWMHKRLQTMHTLESLHIGNLMSTYDDIFLPLNLISFPNLKELSIYNLDLTRNSFFHDLQTASNSLHALEISVPFRAMLSQSAFECIINLKNLTYLSLKLEEELDIQILSELTKLEQLYINFNYKIEWPYHEISEVENLLVKLPNIKQCWFYNDQIHEALTSGNFLNEAKLEEPEDLSWTAWKRVFGIPINSSE